MRPHVAPRQDERATQPAPPAVLLYFLHCRRATVDVEILLNLAASLAGRVQMWRLFNLAANERQLSAKSWHGLSTGVKGTSSMRRPEMQLFNYFASLSRV